MMWVPDRGARTGFLAGAAIVAATAFPVHAADNYVFGRCLISRQSSGVEIRPIVDGNSYLYRYHQADVQSAHFSFNSDDTKVTLIKAPKYGEVALVNTTLGISNNWYHYMPKDGYLGRDRFVMQVDKHGVKVLIHYLIEGLDEKEPETGICKSHGWKISSMKG